MVCTSGSWHSVAIVYLPAQPFRCSLTSLTWKRPGCSGEAPQLLIGYAQDRGEKFGRSSLAPRDQWGFGHYGSAGWLATGFYKSWKANKRVPSTDRTPPAAYVKTTGLYQRHGRSVSWRLRRNRSVRIYGSSTTYQEQRHIL